MAESTCSLWLRDLPHPDGTPTAAAPAEAPAVTNSVQAEARRLRGDGLTLREIAERLGVSTTSAHYWTWDLPVPAWSPPGGDEAHMEMMRRRDWDRVLAEREVERQLIHVEHAERIGRLSAREVELAAVVAYWCEGCTATPCAGREQVTFINSDPGLILLFLAWLDQLGFPEQHRHLSLSVHESADVGAATRWWSAVTRVPVEQFGKPVLERHDPKTVRKNTEQACVGRLVVRLRQCRTPYQRIEGVWQGIMGALPQGGEEDHSRVV